MAALRDAHRSENAGSVPTSYSRHVRAAISTSDRATQCCRRETKGEKTQTDRVTLCSAGCQTEAAFSALFPKSELHLTETGITCKVCCQSFAQEWNARRHWRLHHSVGRQKGPHKDPYYCPYCSFSHSARKRVREHERTHPEAGCQSSAWSSPRRSTRSCAGKSSPRAIRKVHPQQGWNRKTKANLQLKRHTRTSVQVTNASSEKSAACELDVDTDAVTATTDMPFECEMCHKRFSLKQRLLSHTINHASNKAFECEICLQGFTLRDRFTCHMRLHAGNAKLYTCGVCGESFSTKTILAHHKRTQHVSASGSERPYECIVCHEFFPQKMGLLNHYCMSIMSRMVGARGTK